mmetsp:Transcript_14991/g.38128  ORF Transcript_14991/g.38128 Transcript_14991/m.38128 type:complete len:234 (+) Transcript_14991:308-1009(+)
MTSTGKAAASCVKHRSTSFMTDRDVDMAVGSLPESAVLISLTRFPATTTRTTFFARFCSLPQPSEPVRKSTSICNGRASWLPPTWRPDTSATYLSSWRSVGGFCTAGPGKQISCTSKSPPGTSTPLTPTTIPDTSSSTDKQSPQSFILAPSSSMMSESSGPMNLLAPSAALIVLSCEYSSSTLGFSFMSLYRVPMTAHSTPASTSKIFFMGTSFHPEFIFSWMAGLITWSLWK